MQLPLIIETIQPGVLRISLLNEERRLLGSGSAFVVEGKLITCFHVIKPLLVNHANLIVAISFDYTKTVKNFDGSMDLTPAIYWKGSDFVKFIEQSSESDGFDIAILDIPRLREQDLCNFKLNFNLKRRIGDSVAFLGYPLDHYNITCHNCIISSIYESSPAQIIQLNANISTGNSGGPLFNLETGEVIGIINAKQHGFTSYIEQESSTKKLPSTVDAIEKSIEINLKSYEQLLNQSENSNNFYISELRKINNMLLMLAGELKRSANVGIGYAIDINNPILVDMFFK